jgi:hypothetical protein
MTKGGSFIDARAIASRGCLQLFVRFRRVDQRVIEDVSIPRRQRDLLMRVDDALGGRDRVRQHEIAGAHFLVSGGLFELALGLGIQTQMHAVSFRCDSSIHMALPFRAPDMYAI